MSNSLTSNKLLVLSNSYQNPQIPYLQRGGDWNVIVLMSIKQESLVYTPVWCLVC